MSTQLAATSLALFAFCQASVQGQGPSLDLNDSQKLPVVANTNKDMANARKLASVAKSARASGIDFVKMGYQDVNLTVGKIVKGVTARSGPSKGSLFRVPGLTLVEQKAAAKHLRVQEGNLILAGQPPEHTKYIAATQKVKARKSPPQSAFDPRNSAQNFASVSTSAQAAGLDFVKLGGNDLDQILPLLAKGATVKEGPFTGTTFIVPGQLSAAQMAEAKVFLDIKDGGLKFMRRGNDGKQPIVERLDPRNARRMAQNLASVAAAAQAAGYDFVAANGGNREKTIQAIVKGATVPEGRFKGVQFQVANLTANEQKAASAYLVMANGMLNFQEL